jgi:DNA polymerase III subunit delta'
VSISDVRHQSRASRLVQYALSASRVPHAYLFVGPEGVGRELFAQRLATVLLCETIRRNESGSVDACGTCEACVRSADGSHPDLHIIYRELIKQHPKPEIRKRKGINLGIDVIRHFVIDQVARKPKMGRAKVFIVRQAETMADPAQNALLKTLEEPPATTFLILIAKTTDSLLQTVRSRCQTIPFGLLPSEFVKERLLAMNENMDRDVAEFCATHAGGSLGDGQQLFDDNMMSFDLRLAESVSQLGESGVTVLAKDVIESAKKLGEKYRERDGDVSDTEAQRRGLRSLLGLLSDGFRNRLRVSVGAGGPNPSAYGSIGERWSARQTVEAIRLVARTEKQLGFNANVQMTIEGLFVELRRL